MIVIGRCATGLLALTAILIGAGCATSPAPPPIPARSSLPPDHTIQWAQADTLAIGGLNPPADPADAAGPWNAGHVNDVLKLPGPLGGLVVATDTGGVWGIGARLAAVPFSDAWNSVDMSSLALGPDGPSHVYAAAYTGGGTHGALLWETDTSALAPMLNWYPANPQPTCGAINRVLVINRTIVVACDSGVWWSAIPAAPSAHGVYAWTAAVAAADTTAALISTNFSGLALGPTDGAGQPTIVASTNDVSHSAPEQIIFWGGWSGGALVLTPASVDPGPGNLFLQVGRTSVASCAQDPTSMFAVGADATGAMAGLWKSPDGGRTWSLVNAPQSPGTVGWWSNSIGIAGDCHAVALGWPNGTFLSYDSGQTWTRLVNAQQYGDLHGDVHAVIFDPADPTMLYIGSDGGVASAAGLVQGATPTIASNYNRELLNMQIYHAGASSRMGGAVAAGLQDNGVLFAQLPGPWLHLTNCGCDGRSARFVGPGGMTTGTDLAIEGEFSGTPYNWTSDPTNLNGPPLFGFDTNLDVPVAGVPGGILTSDAPVSTVRFQRYLNGAGKIMTAAAGKGQTVYGLFVSADGSGAEWDALGTIGSGQNVSAVSSHDGTDVLVGTDAGNVYQLTQPYVGATASQLTIDQPSGAEGSASIGSVVDLLPDLAFATYRIGGKNYVLKWNGQSWSNSSGLLPNNSSFQSIEAADITAVFVTDGLNVYSSHDQGGAWLNASDGLPYVSQGTELQAMTQPDGTRYLYLATYGWSMWRAKLP